MIHYTPGGLKLGAALIGLPYDPQKFYQPGHVASLVERFRGVPDEVLFDVAAEIQAQVYDPVTPLRRQPRYDELARMVDAALNARAALAALVDERR